MIDESAIERYAKAAGRLEGKLEGMQVGEALGEMRGMANALLQLLHLKFGQVPEWVEQQLAVADKMQLEVWIGRILTATSLSQIFDKDV